MIFHPVILAKQMKLKVSSFVSRKKVYKTANWWTSGSLFLLFWPYLYCFLFVGLNHQHSCHLEVLIIVMSTCIFNQGVNDANQGLAVINCRLSITGVFCYGVADHSFDKFVKIISYILSSVIPVWLVRLHSVLLSG